MQAGRWRRIYGVCHPGGIGMATPVELVLSTADTRNGTSLNRNKIFRHWESTPNRSPVPALHV